MFDPMELERSRIHAEVLAQHAAEAAAKYKILEGTMRLQSLTPSVLARTTGASGSSWGWALLLVLIAAAVGFGAVADGVPAAAATGGVADDAQHGPNQASTLYGR